MFICFCVRYCVQIDFAAVVLYLARFYVTRFCFHGDSQSEFVKYYSKLGGGTANNTHYSKIDLNTVSYTKTNKQDSVIIHIFCYLVSPSSHFCILYSIFSANLCQFIVWRQPSYRSHVPVGKDNSS